jgi:small GTP-binding protein
VIIIDQDGAFKLTIFGDGGVGKTTLVNRYLTKVFDEDLKMTIGADFSIKELNIGGKSVKLRIWDFAGEERFRVLLPSFAKGADGGIFMFDTTRYASLKNLDEWLSIFERNASDQQIKIPIIMVGGKIDLENKRSVDYEEAENLSTSHYLHGYFECSSKTGENIEPLIFTYNVPFRDIRINFKFFSFSYQRKN